MENILKDKYKRSGVIAAILYIIIVSILLLILGMKVPDPPLEEEEVTVEIPLDVSGGSSSGSPDQASTSEENSSTPTKDIQTQEDQTDYVPTSDGETTTEDTEPENQVDENMMFPTGGDGDGQDGDGDGDGDGRLGSGDGDGIGQFTGPNQGSSGRDMLVGPSNDKLDKDKRGIIYLELIVDKDGKVLSIEYYPTKSTSQDQELIQHAKKMCRRIKFEASSKATTEIVGPFIFKPN